MTASRDASVVTVLGESVMNDMTDTTGGSRVCRVSDDGCDGPRARAGGAVKLYHTTDAAEEILADGFRDSSLTDEEI